MNVMEIYDENGNLVSYMEEDGTVVGDDIEVASGDIIEAEIVEPTEKPVVYLYTEGDKWDQIKVDDGDWTDLNGVYLSYTVPFAFQMKDTETDETTETYDVVGKGYFFIHDDGTWEKIGDIGE